MRSDQPNTSGHAAGTAPTTGDTGVLLGVPHSIEPSFASDTQHAWLQVWLAEQGRGRMPWWRRMRRQQPPTPTTHRRTPVDLARWHAGAAHMSASALFWGWAGTGRTVTMLTWANRLVQQGWRAVLLHTRVSDTAMLTRLLHQPGIRHQQVPADDHEAFDLDHADWTILNGRHLWMQLDPVGHERTRWYQQALDVVVAACTRRTDDRPVVVLLDEPALDCARVRIALAEAQWQLAGVGAHLWMVLHSPHELWATATCATAPADNDQARAAGQQIWAHTALRCYCGGRRSTKDDTWAPVFAPLSPRQLDAVARAPVVAVAGSSIPGQLITMYLTAAEQPVMFGPDTYHHDRSFPPLDDVLRHMPTYHVTT